MPGEQCADSGHLGQDGGTHPTTKYTTTPDGASIAFQQIGDTGPDLVFVTGGASNCELFWELPGWAHYLRRLGSFSRMVWFDKRGTGLSDRDVSTTAVEARMLDIGVVMDAVGMERAVLVGMSEGSLMSALFAATFPERVDGLVLMSGMTHGGAVPLLEPLAASASELWGTGTALAMMWAHGIADDQLLGRIERSMGTPTAMARLARITMDFDVRPVLPLVQAPTVVAHCADDPIIPVAAGPRAGGGDPGRDLRGAGRGLPRQRATRRDGALRSGGRAGGGRRGRYSPAHRARAGDGAVHRHHRLHRPRHRRGRPALG